jgi:protein-S-isoprenylcysteine O-methyltransferase Ste14
MFNSEWERLAFCVLVFLMAIFSMWFGFQMDFMLTHSMCAKEGVVTRTSSLYDRPLTIKCEVKK